MAWIINLVAAGAACHRMAKHQRRDSTDGRAAALNPADPGSNPVVPMLQRALRLSASAGRHPQLFFFINVCFSRPTSPP